jgi:hypothetical protein
MYRRSKETIQVECKCLRLIRAVDSNSFGKAKIIIGDLNIAYPGIWNRWINRQLNSDLMLELKYITILYERMIRYSVSIILKHPSIQLTGQNEN